MAKMRIHEFAKELDIPGKDIVAILEEMGESGKTVSSSIDDEMQEKVRKKLKPEPKKEAVKEKKAVKAEEPAKEPAKTEPQKKEAVKTAPPKTEGVKAEPEKKAVAPKPETPSADTAKEPLPGCWTCQQCGYNGNTGKFCAECGSRR